MTSLFRYLWLFVGIASATLTLHGAEQDPDAPQKLLKQAQSEFQPLPKDAFTKSTPYSAAQVELGRQLFFDPRFSVDGTVSCSRCHLPALYGTDGLAKAEGVFDRVNDRRAPTILNAALQFKAHWRGDRENVEDQARRALTGHASFGNADNAAALTRLKSFGYEEAFAKAFPLEKEPVSIEHWGQSIGAYERTLITPGRFDTYLAGKTDALSADEQRGLQTFIKVGCADCHHGPVVGGDSFQKFGVFADYWKQTGSATIDKGRFDVTGDSNDLYVFKVAGLRNVAMAPPYFHDGSVKSLDKAVRVMAIVQLDTTLTDQQTSDIVTFLKSLTGELPENFATAPKLPAGAFDASLRAR